MLIKIDKQIINRVMSVGFPFLTMLFSVQALVLPILGWIPKTLSKMVSSFEMIGFLVILAGVIVIDLYVSARVIEGTATLLGIDNSEQISNLEQTIF